MTIRQDMHFFLLNLTQKTFLKCRHTKGYGSAGIFKQSQATIAPTDTESLRETVIKKHSISSFNLIQQLMVF